MKQLVRLLAGLALVGACTGDPSPTDAGDVASLTKGVPSVTSPEALRDIALLRATIAPYHRFEVGSAAGWNDQFPPGCFTSATGAMGYHYRKISNVGSLEVTRPQLLIYEPGKNGQKNLVAVEYIVPGAPTDTPPVLYGIPLHYNSAFGVWVLHVWAFKENPLGIFNDWNPQASCQYASDVVHASVAHH